LHGWSRRRESNPRPTVYETVCPPFTLFGTKHCQSDTVPLIRVPASSSCTTMHLIMHHMLLNGAALLQNLSLRVDHAHPVMTDYLDEVAGYVGKTGSPAGGGLSCVRSTTSDIGFDSWFPSNFDRRKKTTCRSFCQPHRHVQKAGR